ncbi:hypothetical protein CRP01_14070 [Flavilitoribacter nigricans DSM 23189 = NBRC 102662]|uniref:Uncharacterized protein n=2 Tax=Flavilitoribacter TaxID=2762562 RepID=A0A2D0NC59_FLAN2|nr:hypothetical protein CRP01_14070 [Flavilitoribacter nigricans DSM 23189 = NBRC 102662]
MLALAVLPCADEGAWCVFDLEDSFGLEFHEGGSHNHHNDCEDHCSPLCICSCCHITVRTPVRMQVALKVPIRIFSTQPAHRSFLADLTSIHDIWQPPRRS